MHKNYTTLLLAGCLLGFHTSGAMEMEKVEDSQKRFRNAVENNEILRVKELIGKEGIDLDCQVDSKVDPNEDRPLHTAARGSFLAVVKLLLHNGADPEALNGFGDTPLDVAREKLDTVVYDEDRVFVKQVHERIDDYVTGKRLSKQALAKAQQEARRKAAKEKGRKTREKLEAQRAARKARQGGGAMVEVELENDMIRAAKILAEGLK